MIWEYKTALNSVNSKDQKDKSTGFNIAETDSFLNLMGLDNWELVDVKAINEGGSTIQLAYFFKRPLAISSSQLPDIGYDIDNNGITGSQR
jgi:hypothetical protein